MPDWPSASLGRDEDVDDLVQDVFLEAGEQVSASIPLLLVPGRVNAMTEFYEHNGDRPNLYVGIHAFHEGSLTLPFHGVSLGPPPMLPAMQGALGKASDLQGALERAEALLAEDMEATLQERRARSKYVVVVLSKGVPFPRCSANDSLSSYASPLEPSGIWADSPGAEEFCNNGSTNPGEELPGFEPGGDRNQSAQLIAAVERIVSLKRRFAVGDVRVHTALLFDSAAIASCGAACQDVALGLPGRNLGRYTLDQLALHGQGTFIDPGPPQQLTLDGLDTTEFTTSCP